MEIDTFREMVEKSGSIVFFGGAGVSTESGIPDFRSSTGIYGQKTRYSYPPEVMLSHSFFMEHTEEFFEFYKEKMIYKDAKPNAAHIALAKLEKHGKLKAVITQNIDGLHQAAGSENVIELHGSIHRNRCMKCNESYDLEYVLNSPGTVPLCKKCNGIVKPCVVLYEEPLDTDSIDRAVDYIEKADMLIVGGTSLAVYPAAGLIQYYRGDRLVLINKSPTPYDRRANLIIRDSIGAVLGSVV
ncbi:MAG TPA: NAD-dependent protein deacylase [Hungateiclostridium thermocellum]|jgi:NAD-dependent deacetylase|uniref:NAD-dependent protein deacetylase n=2 Tax=Acetivibrio thermocellus TaxID=1515 RepID=A3DBH9_ACET2|nr:NAD-dependent protein deacylase [Acetivibrio thermocellus]CDG34750.1 NAD-dependent protein deacetylase [Acetivibrio thermocellus BC1]ABN51308.1 Silent information regulator protein Sir2 [Acetivibrio thermocellus ATCC 27405]ADU75205.1 Silent information regulator protein Sir2 [Acetivibrio thermocellus DSM 1313]ALX09180.1 Silent information regulator protein Sir2 [Acetivibrio thermocellus AD2]ANV76932.1 Silent information regulator protein Sir2 [Acetivibrio thermocellus DSM 2360]